MQAKLDLYLPPVFAIIALLYTSTKKHTLIVFRNADATIRTDKRLVASM